MNTVDNLRRLRQHFTQEQAEDILAVIDSQAVTRDYLDRRVSELDSRLAGTRDYLDRRFTDVDSRFTVLRSEIDARLEAMEKRLILWGIGLTGVIVTLVTTLERAIPR